MGKWKKSFIDIIEEFKSTTSSWKMYLIAETLFDWNEDNNTVKKEIFIQIIHKTNMLQTDSNVSVDDIIKSIGKDVHLKRQM